MTKVIQLFPAEAVASAMHAEPKKTRKPKGYRNGKLVQVTKSFGRKPNGKRDTKVFYGRTLKEACEKRDAYIESRKAGALLNDPDITLDNWASRWMELYKSNLERGNKQNYVANVVRLKEYRIGGTRLGDMRMQDIQEAHLQNALDATAGKSTSLIDKYIMVIQQIFSKARKNKIIRDDPSDDLKQPDGTTGTHRALERWEADCILNSYHKHRCGLWAMIGMLAGLRPGELYALKWSDVDLDKRIISVYNASERIGNMRRDKDRTKTAAGMRELPICDPLLEAFQRVPESRRVGHVAVSASGVQLTESAAGRGWDGFQLAMTRILRGEPVIQQGRQRKPKTDEQKAAFAALPCMDFRPHDLRHTFATALYDAGVDVKTAQYYLGHADIHMTMALYTHLSKEKEKESRAALVGFLDNWLKKASPMLENAAKKESQQNC